MSTDKKKTLAQVVKETGIGNSTVRKYLRDFKEFIPTQKGPRKTPLMDNIAVERIRLIRQGYQARKSFEEIREELNNLSCPPEEEREDPPMVKGHEPLHDPPEDPRLW